MTKKSPQVKPDQETVEQVEQKIWEGWNEATRIEAVNRLLAYHERQSKDDRSHVYDALLDCAMESVPLPEWLRTEILCIHDDLLNQNGNLHDLFGLESKYPSKGKRGRKARKDSWLQGQLYSRARFLIAHHMTKEQAIKQAIKDLKFPYGQRKSRDMFDAQSRLADDYANVVRGVKKHRTE